MTSQQDTELRDVLQDFIIAYVLDEQKHLTRPETKTKEWFDAQFEDTMNEAVAALTAWKDKEVELERQNRIKKNKSFCGCPMCEHHSEPYSESLQSQGGKNE